MTTRQWALIPRSRAQWLTLALTVALAAAATAVTVHYSGTGAVLSSQLPTWTMFVGLAAMFGLGERLSMVIEFRRQAHTITLAGPALVLGALLAPVPVVVLARLVGAGLALGVQRMAPTKLFYNVASFSCEAALVTALGRGLVPQHDRLDLTTVVTLLAVFVVVDQFISVLVLLMIRIHNGPVSLRDAVGVLMPSMVMTTVSVAVATGGLMIADQGAAGALIVVITAATSAMLYRGYLNTRRRHAALELVHEFVTDKTGSESVAEAAQQLLDRVRTLLRAGRVEMTVAD